MSTGAVRYLAVLGLLAVSRFRGAEPAKSVGPNVGAESALAAPIPANSPADPTAAAAPEPAAPPASKPIVHDGQTFVLASSTATKSVQTDEYTTSGEKLGDWTQLVTVQRLTLDKPTSAEAFVAYFQKRVAEDGATLDVLTRSPSASVFAVRFPKSDRNDEQVMICLALADPSRTELLNIIQYAIKPMKCPVEQAAARIKSWRDRFVTQATATPPISS